MLVWLLLLQVPFNVLGTSAQWISRIQDLHMNNIQPVWKGFKLLLHINAWGNNFHQTHLSIVVNNLWNISILCPSTLSIVLVNNLFSEVVLMSHPRISSGSKTYSPTQKQYQGTGSTNSGSGLVMVVKSIMHILLGHKCSEPHTGELHQINAHRHNALYESEFSLHENWNHVCTKLHWYSSVGHKKCSDITFLRPGLPE